MGQIACFRTGFRKLEGIIRLVWGKIGRENGEGGMEGWGARFGDGEGNGNWKEERGMMAEVHLRQRDASGGWETDGHQGCSNQGKS